MLEISLQWIWSVTDPDATITPYERKLAVLDRARKFAEQEGRLQWVQALDALQPLIHSDIYKDMSRHAELRKVLRELMTSVSAWRC